MKISLAIWDGGLGARIREHKKLQGEGPRPHFCSSSYGQSSAVAWHSAGWMRVASVGFLASLSHVEIVAGILSVNDA